MKEGDKLIDKKQFNKQLPDKYELENDVKIGKDVNIHSKDELYAVAMVNKNGSRRLSNNDAEKVKEALEDYTGLEWKVDNVSNFVFHLEDTDKIEG